MKNLVIIMLLAIPFVNLESKDRDEVYRSGEYKKYNSIAINYKFINKAKVSEDKEIVFDKDRISIILIGNSNDTSFLKLIRKFTTDEFVNYDKSHLVDVYVFLMDGKMAEETQNYMRNIKSYSIVKNEKLKYDFGVMHYPAVIIANQNKVNFFMEAYSYISSCALNSYLLGKLQDTN